MSNRNLKEFKPERYPLHDHGQGDLFADWFQNILRYVPERKCYYVYNKEQGIWEMDMLNLKAMEYSKELADALTVYLCSMEDSDKKKELQKVWGKWQFFRYRETILKEAKSVQPISLKEFDNKPSLFNCTNGTLDLETFDFREHDPHDFLTKVSGTEYNPESGCPMWESFIRQSTEGNEEKSIYLQKALGYSLTGTAEHECFFILYGSTSRNGKGTCLRTMLEMMGSYGATANASTISKQDKQRSGSQPTEDIARLAGARFVNISEPDKGMELSSALIKTLPGQDCITARYLNENSFEYLPQFKLFINTNHLPKVTDSTVFESDRVKVITFDRHLSEEERDPDLKHKLSKEHAGILNWCIDGLRILRETGFDAPECVRIAVDEYAETSNRVLQFVEDEMEQGLGYEVKPMDVYSRYKSWAFRNGYKNPLGSNNFKKDFERMLNQSAVSKRPASGGNATKLYIGWRLKPIEEPDDLPY